MSVKHPITVIAICGTNKRLFNSLQRQKNRVAPRIDLRPYEFVPNVYELNRAADILLTKGGPNAMLDSVLMGVPIGVFYCASDIEYQSMHLFTSILNCGRFFKTSYKIVRWINDCVTNPAILDIYKEAAQEVRDAGNGAVQIAKFIQTYE